MNAHFRQLTFAIAGAALIAGSVSCGNVVREGRSPSILVIDSLVAESGAKPGVFAVPLLSDTITLVNKTVNGVQTKVPTIFDDPAQVTMRVVVKDQGPTGSGVSPSPVNAVTITRYHVQFIRADGHNIQGVDVPYAFDGGATATVTDIGTTMGFEIVRHQAKEEAPLVQLDGGGGLIHLSTIAEVTFYGKDLVGNDVQATGTISVNFADFGDPD